MNETSIKKTNDSLFKLQDISIKFKLILLTILSMLVLSVTLATVSIAYVKETLIEEKYKTLTSARDSKIKQLSAIFKLYKKQITLLTGTSYVQGLTKEFNEVHN